MNCENVLCVYQKEDCCLLEHISIDAQAHCTQCIEVDFPAELLELEKLRILQQLS